MLNTNNIININNLDEILSSEKTLYEYNNMYINVYRTKNDINGNPIYYLRIYDNKYNNITEGYKSKYRKYYKKGEYLRIQSYNLSNTLENILNKED